MIASAIGISLGLVVILTTVLLSKLNKETIYGLILCGIGFLYVGYTWSDTVSLTVNIIQAVIFLFIAYFGMRKNLSFMIAGFFLHGIWDLVYGYLYLPDLLPPHYDMFCMSIDFVMGIYLAILKVRLDQRRRQPEFESAPSQR